MLTHEHDGRVALDLNGPTGAAVGVGLALVMIAPIALFLGDSEAFQFIAVLLGFVGGVYLGFGVASGSVSELLLEFTVAGAFMLVAAVALWVESPVVLAAGYAAHGLWDLVHHPRAVTTPVRGWYPPFCVLFDVVMTGYVLIRF